MALQKQSVALNFAQGLDTKTDPFQLDLGNFSALRNSVFNTTKRLTKRNGFKNITNLPDANQTTLTTLNDNLIATGSDLFAFSQDTNQWLNQGIVQPVQLSVQPLVRVSTSQQSPDTAVTSLGLTCLVYVDNSLAYYQISDSNTGQQIATRTALPATATSPRVYLLGSYFIITFIATVAGTPTLQYIAIPIATPTMPKVPANISASVDTLNAGYDADILGDNLYIAWGQSGGSVGVAYLTSSLVVASITSIPGAVSNLMSVTTDPDANIIWVTYWDSTSMNGYSAAFNLILGNTMTPTQIITATNIAEITSISLNNVLHVFYENINNYTYLDSSAIAIRSDYISKLTVTPPVVVGPGTPSAPTVMVRSVGLASKAFIGVDGVIYMLTVYGSNTQINPLDNTNESTYFLVNSDGQVYMRLAGGNAGGYAKSQVLPNVFIMNDTYYIPYMIADFLTTVNKGTNLPAGTPTNAIYTQYGINLSKFSLNTTGQFSSEIAGALHLTGGQLWEYDGVSPVEHGFQVYPENVVVSTATGSGSIAAGTYFYVFTYEWTDNQGNLHRSAPSIPFKQVTTTPSSTNTIRVPTLRLTYKLAPNPVRIVGYRYSVAQPVYYQFTSVTAPVINNTTIDSVTIIDTASDLSILGQTVLYTTGGVLENIAAPASIASALFSNRLFIIDAEDPNLLWFSKQVIQNVPVEMSDNLTLFIAPTTGAQGSTGAMTALSAMDDKLIIFKKDAIYYLNGNGPDNTGANSTFSDPVFITATVGCENPNSIVLMPSGIMFQSDKGIWLLGRDLQTVYIGAPVEAYNNIEIMSAETIPGTNQVRFVMANNITLMYDYFFNQWATHDNRAAISATLYQGLHTYLNSYGQVFQENPGSYVDGSTPVLMGLTTAWINVAGIQGYERFYFANLLGTYLSPFKLNVSLAYDYNPSAIQSTIVLPNNSTQYWGDEALWGSGGPWGGPGDVFTARLFPTKQKCQSFQVTIQEVYDSESGVQAGQGLTLSGLALIVGLKKGYRTQSAAKSFG